jgi:hypothetical protein
LATGGWVTVAKTARQNGRWDDLRAGDRQQLDVVVVGHSDLWRKKKELRTRTVPGIPDQVSESLVARFLPAQLLRYLGRSAYLARR